MSKFATISLAAALALPAIGCAQDRGDTAGARGTRAVADKSGKAQRGTARRLESFTWNPVKHELTWVVSTGDETNGGGYKPNTQDNYVINLEAATMTYNGESRRFSREEASNVQMIMDLISKYTVDSTIWWQQGHGIKLDKDGNPIGGGDEGEGTTTSKGVKRVYAPSQITPDAALASLEQQLQRLTSRQKMQRAGLGESSR